MTECAETILLPPTNPSAHEQEEHGTMTPLSYVTVRLDNYNILVNK
jgi:hypothetical protein